MIDITSKTAIELVEELNKKGLTKVSCYPRHHRRFPAGREIVTTQALSLPADSWNSGHDKRIYVMPGAKVLRLTKEWCQDKKFFGTDEDRIRGLWVEKEKFEYGYPEKGEPQYPTEGY